MASRWACVSLLALCACGGGSQAPRRTVFDPTGGANSVVTGSRAEVPYPPLDLTETPGGLRWMGVSVLHGAAHFSRPSHWRIRDASDDPGRSYVWYVSPKAYTFAIYERDDKASAGWEKILSHYESDVAASGAKIVGQRVPIAAGLNQGRAYTIERRIQSGPTAVLSRSREILVRSEHSVVVLQIVAQDDGLARIAPEALEILRHIEVL